LFHANLSHTGLAGALDDPRRQRRRGWTHYAWERLELRWRSGRRERLAEDRGDGLGLLKIDCGKDR
jgi:hypothetical protein